MSNEINAFLAILNGVLLNVAVYLPRIAGGIAVFFIGWIVANVLKGTTQQFLSTLRNSEAVKKTPANDFFESTDFGNKLEVIAAKAVYALSMLVVIYTAASVLGLQSLTQLLEQIISYIPHLLAALIIFIFGVVAAGFIESLVKSAVRSVDQKSSILAGKLAGYFVLSIAALAAVSELGIAREFILILFIGFVAMISLGFGLAIGLGSKDLISEILKNWYKQKSAK